MASFQWLVWQPRCSLGKKTLQSNNESLASLCAVDVNSAVDVISAGDINSAGDVNSAEEPIKLGKESAADSSAGGLTQKRKVDREKRRQIAHEQMFSPPSP